MIIVKSYFRRDLSYAFVDIEPNSVTSYTDGIRIVAQPNDGWACENVDFYNTRILCRMWRILWQSDLLDVIANVPTFSFYRRRICDIYDNCLMNKMNLLWIL